MGPFLGHDIQDNDTQLNNKFNATLSIMTLNTVATLSVANKPIMLSVVAPLI